MYHPLLLLLLLLSVAVAGVLNGTTIGASEVSGNLFLKVAIAVHVH